MGGCQHRGGGRTLVLGRIGTGSAVCVCVCACVYTGALRGRGAVGPLWNSPSAALSNQYATQFWRSRSLHRWAHPASESMPPSPPFLGSTLTALVGVWAF